jgi:hypothetical protein
MNNITDLRQHLFDALRGLSDKQNPLDIDRAKAVAEVSQTIINSVRAETEHMKVTGQNTATGFIPAQPASGRQPAIPVVIDPPDKPSMADQLAGANVRTHKLRG